MDLLKLLSQRMVSLFKKIFKILIPYLPKLFDYNLNMAVYILLTANNFKIYKYNFIYATQFIQTIITFYPKKWTITGII